MFHHHLCAASSGVILSVLLNIAVVGGWRKMSDSNAADAVVLEVHLLPSRCQDTAVPTASAGALGLAQRLPHCGRGGSQTPNSPMSSSKSVFFLLVAGLLLFPLPVLGLSAWCGDFRVSVGEKARLQTHRCCPRSQSSSSQLLGQRCCFFLCCWSSYL